MRYEAGVGPQFQAAGRGASANFSEFRSNRSYFAADAIGRAYVPSAAGGAERRHPGLHALEWALQLVLPVLLLFGLGAVAFLFGDQPVTRLGSGTWLTLGHLMIPLTFFCIALTNRRYGGGAALAVTLIAWSLGILAILLDPAGLAGIAGRALPGLHTMLGFGGGLAAGQIFSVAVFDLTRGPRWAVAPFLAWLSGGLMFVLIAVPATLPAASWNGDFGHYAGYMAAAAVVMLLPYWMLRSAIPPRSGFGGY